MSVGRTLRGGCLALLVLALFLFLIPARACAAPARTFLPEEEPPARAALPDKLREENLRQVRDYLRGELKLPDSAVAAILANIYRESAFDPRAVDPSGGFTGLCQWSKTRWAECVSFCIQERLDRFSVEGQMAFLQYELNGEFRWLYEQFLLPAEDSEDGAQEAQYYFCMHFEVPLDLDWEQVARSKLVAEAYWPYVAEDKPLDWG